MEYEWLHVFALSLDGSEEILEFPMLSATGDPAEAVDAFSKWVARQEDNFLLVGEDLAVRANRVSRIRHLRVEPRS